MLKKTVAFLILIASLAALSPQAVVRRRKTLPYPLFSDKHGVAAGTPRAPIWGTAANDETVTVTFQGQKVSTTTNGGKWMATLGKLKAGGPFEMTVAGKSTVVLKNVLVGDIWVCSGQSNMEFPVSLSVDGNKAIADSKNFRIPAVPRSPRRLLWCRLADCRERVRHLWAESVPNFSAVAYYFGRELERMGGVPIGLIHTSWGGTPAESVDKAGTRSSTSHRSSITSMPATTPWQPISTSWFRICKV